MLDVDPGIAAAGRRWIVDLRRRVRALLAAGVSVGLASSAGSTDLGRLFDLRLDGQARLWLGPDDGPLPDKSSLLGQVLDFMDTRGVGAGLVLAVGDALLTGAALSDRGADVARVAAVAFPGTTFCNQAVLALLEEQVRRRRTRRTPVADEDPEWIIREVGRDPMRHRITETLFTVGAFGLGTRGAREEAPNTSHPLVLAAGLYTSRGPGEHLLPGPEWTGLAIVPPVDDDGRVLDLRTGVLSREEVGPTGHPVRSLRFASITVPGVVALRAEAESGRLRPVAPLRAPEATTMTFGRAGRRIWARTGDATGSGIGAVARQRDHHDAHVHTLERVAAYVVDRDGPPDLARASESLDHADQLGFDRLLAEQRAEWARRWETVDVRIPDDPDAQLGLRFALFQLWSNAARHDELAVGARGLSGTGYAGHVFWDADVFVLPALSSIDPEAATAMLRYRRRRLAAARAEARRHGADGARFPWESASEGRDVTPTVGSLGGAMVPIQTGQREEHVTADVAWAAGHHADWTGASAAMRRLVDPLLVQTARYWASRMRPDANGRLHIDDVIGPDEYHESVNDNAYTNVMARWNLRAGAAAVERSGVTDEATAEASRWLALAERVVDGYDPMTGRYEQFAGYFELEPLLVARIGTPPIAADLLLGQQRVAASQVSKQPDVLMLHHLVPREVQEGSLLPNLDFYGPRTAHGSSLSPSITASLLARAGRPDEALRFLRVALDLDVHDDTGMTSAGLHMANLGGVWQAVLTGFAGVSVRAGVLTVDPHLPAAWGSLELRFRCLGSKVRLSITQDDVVISTDRRIQACLAGRPSVVVDATSRLGRPEDESTNETRWVHE